MKTEQFQAMTRRLVEQGKARVVWSPRAGWAADAEAHRRAAVSDAVARMVADHSLDRWHDDGGAHNDGAR